jgi:DNA-binding HxlR family transcriptional regulator
MIDRTIIKALYDNNTLSANELRRHVERSYKKVGPSVFFDHIKHLMKQESIGKNDTGRRGCKVYYFLTEKSKETYRVGILEVTTKNVDTNAKHRQRIRNSFEKENEELMRQKMYLLLFFFGTVDHPVYELRSEREINRFLSRFGLSMNDLKPIEEGFGRNGLLRATITTPLMIYRPKIVVDNKLAVWPLSEVTPPYKLYIKRYEPILGKIKFWRELYAYFDYEDVTSIRPELNKIKHMIKNGFKGCSNIRLYLYRYTLPGISADDLLNHERFVFEHINLTREEVQKALTLLLEKRILYEVLKFEGHQRFSIADPALEEVIFDCWEILQKVREIAFSTWMYLRKPNELERKWLAVFYGNEKSESILRRYYNYRKNFQVVVRKDKEFTETLESGNRKLKGEVRESIDELYKKCEKGIIKEYGFPIDILIELIYPETLRQAHKKELGAL